MASKAASGSVRKVHVASCSQRQKCTCGGRGVHRRPCPKAERCRCDGRWQARLTTPNGTVIAAPSTFRAKIDAEEWVKAERTLMEDPATYVTAQTRLASAREQARIDAANTFGAYADRYLTERDLRPNTAREYRRLLDTVLLPAFGGVPLKSMTREMVREWHGSLPKKTPAANAAIYRLLRSIMNAAEDEELIAQNPVRIPKASNARVLKVQKPSPVDELAIIVNAMPERLRLFIVLAAFGGMREGEIFELRRGDVDPATGAIAVTRKIEKDANRTAEWACPDCGRVIGPPKTARGVRVVHLPPAFLPMLQAHLLAHTAPGELGLLFPGERKDHMSARYLLSRYEVAREAAGRPDLTIHGLRHSALTLAGQHGATPAELQARAGQHGATPAELQARAGHASLAAMAIYRHATIDRDRQLADRVGSTVASSTAWIDLLRC